ncbi:unnamed protein product [Urochloa decumbens]|uniref:NB-ARC domain-containing protein n=1 Tax=Urochloa decumbens TaxID=240449 RepID=A0ABC9FKA2_9POAL
MHLCFACYVVSEPASCSSIYPFLFQSWFMISLFDGANLKDLPIKKNMDLLAVSLGDLASRSVNFIINKCSKPPAVAVEDNLQRALLRAQVIVVEAMGRNITNQAMLLQLNMLSNAMHQSQYVLDAFRYQQHNEEDTKDQAVSCSSSLSKVNNAKHICFSSKGAHVSKELREALDNLRSMILDANELVMFLTRCPRLYRQPYSTHLQLTNCMFGRQMEAQMLINFLLGPEPHGAEELEVLPIVGPKYIGKSTLVAHACKDERVCGHFSKILFFGIHDFTDDATFREGCATNLENCMSNSNKDRRLLVVVEIDADLSEEALNRLYCASKQYVPSGSKIILTSQFGNIIRFGTTLALTLKHLSHEAYWYFFKTLAFEGTDPEMHPRLMQLAMEIAMTQRRSLNGANIIGRLLRDNFDVQFWSKVLAFWRGSTRRICRFGEHPCDPLDQNKHAYLGRMAAQTEDVVVLHRQQRSSEEDVPKIRMEDVVYGSIKLHGKVDALLWKSRIPPYYSYIYTCEIRMVKTTGFKRKRPMESRMKP